MISTNYFSEINQKPLIVLFPSQGFSLLRVNLWSASGRARKEKQAKKLSAHVKDPEASPPAFRQI